MFMIINYWRGNMAELSDPVEKLKNENMGLLQELAAAYKSMESILEASASEKEIAYQELDKKFTALAKTYEELNQKENMLVHLDKLSSIGQFIAEIIHELKNPLTVISGVTELALLKELPDDVKTKLQKIPVQVDRMSSYLDRFKAMAYKNKEDFKIFELNENLSDFLETIELIKPKNITIDRHLDTKKMKVLGDPYQINQIYLNLAKNSFDAIGENGSSLLVSSKCISNNDLLNNNDFQRAVSCQEENVWEKIIHDHEYFGIIEFKDDGSGIPTELIENIFSAFFTTKERGKGTGLGLSISSDIAKTQCQSYGQIGVWQRNNFPGNYSFIKRSEYI